MTIFCVCLQNGEPSDCLQLCFWVRLFLFCCTLSFCPAVLHTTSCTSFPHCTLCVVFMTHSLVSNQSASSLPFWFQTCVTECEASYLSCWNSWKMDILKVLFESSWFIQCVNAWAFAIFCTCVFKEVLYLHIQWSICYSSFVCVHHFVFGLLSEAESTMLYQSHFLMHLWILACMTKACSYCMCVMLHVS